MNNGYRGSPILKCKLSLVVLLAVSFTACGKNSTPPAASNAATCSTLAGHYYDQYSSSDTMDIANNCTFTDSVCGYTASYTIPDVSTGATIITVAGTNGTPGCMSSNPHACVIQSNGVQLAVNCDSGAHLFLFIKQ